MQVDSLAQQTTVAMPSAILALEEGQPAHFGPGELEGLFFSEEDKEREDEEKQKVGGARTLGLEP